MSTPTTKTGKSPKKANPKVTGKGLGKSFGAKRHRRILRDNIAGLKKPNIADICHKGGVPTIGNDVYEEMRFIVRDDIETILKVAITLTGDRKQKTVSQDDITNAINMMTGTTICYSKVFAKNKKSSTN